MSANANSSSFPFLVEYAKSSRGTCKTSKTKIAEGTLRIGVVVKSRHYDGFQTNWSKASAYFASKRNTNKPQSTDEIGGFDDLRSADQLRIEHYIQTYAPHTKVTDAKPVANIRAVRQQNDIVWKVRDCTTKNPTALPLRVVKTVLEANRIPVVQGTSTPDLIRSLAEAVVFGVASPGNPADGCCGKKPLHFSSYYCRYVCQATLEWGPCPYSKPVEETHSVPVVIPDNVQKDHQEWYNAIKKAAMATTDTFTPQTRLFVAKKNLPTPPHMQHKNRKSNSPMKLKQAKKGIAKMHLSRARVDQDSGQAQQYHVLDEAYDFSSEAANRPDPTETFPIELYDTTLCITDLSTGTNSQYRLQILVRDDQKEDPEHCYLWRAWGRVGGAGGGGNKLTRFAKLDDAKAEFCQLFHKHTGNNWEDRKSFVKHPNKFFQLDVSYDESDESRRTTMASAVGSSPNSMVVGDPASKIPRRLHPVISSIFSKDLAKAQLQRLNFDVDRMPLGNMTEAQLRDAYSVLTEIEQVLCQSPAPPAAASVAASSLSDSMKAGKLQQLSNQFYSKCPSTDPKLIDTTTLLKEKIEMVDELINLQASDRVTGGKLKTNAKSPIDEAYEKLETKLTPLDPAGEEYQLLKTYVANTRNATLPGISGWKGNDWERRGLRLIDAFSVERKCEAARFEASKSLGNRRLLWHGSRISNYTGILSQGLRIAPPEAPVSGYRFGKGIYFADMLGKSANYCRTSGSSEMLVMACDVSLGKTFETSVDMYMDKAQPGTDSTHALSQIVPDPTATREILDPAVSAQAPSVKVGDTNKVAVPLGKPVSASFATRPCCDVSEFIVYNQNQVNIRYLLRLTTDANLTAVDEGVNVSTGDTPVMSAVSAAAVSSSSPSSLLPLPLPSSKAILAAKKRRRVQLSTSTSPSSTAASSTCGSIPPAKRIKSPGATFIKLDDEDRSVPSRSGLKLLNCRTFAEGLRLTVVRGDITESKTDAIVVPSDSSLSLSGMVGNRVKQVAGASFVEEVRQATGRAVPTAIPPSTSTTPVSKGGGLPGNFCRIGATLNGQTIREMATAHNIPYLTPYYRVEKKENISQTKDILCVELDGTFHRGNDARTFLGLGSGKKETISAAQIPTGAEVFVQSSSHNRKIPYKSAIVLETGNLSNAVTQRAAGTTRTSAAVSKPLGLATSDVYMVKGHALPASHVVFVVSPTSGAIPALEKAVNNVLEKIAKARLKTVTLPSIGTGRAGMDKGTAVKAILDAISNYLDKASSAAAGVQTIEEVCFCLFDDESLEAYTKGISAHDQANA